MTFDEEKRFKEYLMNDTHPYKNRARRCYIR